MPTKPSYGSAQAQAQDGQAGLRGDGHRHGVGDAGRARRELLASRNSAAQLAQPRRSSALSLAPGRGSAQGALPQSASGMARRAQRGGSRRRCQPAPQWRSMGLQRPAPSAREAAARQAQHLGARCAASQSQSLSTWRLKPGARIVAAGRWVWPWISSARPAACIQRTARGARRRRAIGRRRRALARFALRRACSAAMARRSASGLARKSLLPRGAAHLAPEGMVVGVGQAQRVAVGQQQALAARRQHRRVGQGQSCRRSRSISRADQEVAVAGHEGQSQRRLAGVASTSTQRRSKPAWRGVVADPDLEQVAEDEHRIGRRVRACSSAQAVEGARRGLGTGAGRR